MYNVDVEVLGTMLIWSLMYNVDVDALCTMLM